MKKSKFLIVAAMMSFVALLSFTGCSSSTLLIGTWQDSKGNEIEFVEDGTFNSSIAVGGITEELSGTFAWQEGSTAINFYVSDGRILLSVFEINGGILKMSWATDTSTTELLSLQKIK